MKKMVLAILLCVVASCAFSQVPAATSDFFKLIDWVTHLNLKS